MNSSHDINRQAIIICVTPVSFDFWPHTEPNVDTEHVFIKKSYEIWKLSN